MSRSASPPEPKENPCVRTLMEVRPCELCTSTSTSPERLECTLTIGLSHTVTSNRPARLDTSTVPRGSALNSWSELWWFEASNGVPAARATTVMENNNGMRISNPLASLAGFMHGRQDAHFILIGVQQELLQ